MFDEHIQRSRPERVIRTAAWDRWWLLVGGLRPVGHDLGPETLVGIDLNMKNNTLIASATSQGRPAAAADRLGRGLGLGTGCRRGPAGLRRLAGSALGTLADRADCAASGAPRLPAAMLLVVLAWRTARTARPAALARRLDIAVNSSGEILTGWELDRAVSTRHDSE